MADYDTACQDTVLAGEAVLAVFYRLRQSGGARGSDHFAVWVAKETGETRIFRGR